MAKQDPLLFERPFDEQMQRMWDYGFGSGYLFAPYMKRLGYDAKFVVPNCQQSQLKWMKDHGITPQYPQHWEYEVAWHQINHYRPDVVFFTEPLTLDSKFIRMLPYRPKVILGWRASIIPEGTDWSEFDAILTNLSALRDIAVRLGAKRSLHFWPGFEERLYQLVKSDPITEDLVFCGQWTQYHEARNKLVTDLVTADENKSLGFSLGMYISGSPSIMPQSIAARTRGPRFGVEYCKAIRSGAISLDARGTELFATDPTTGNKIDLFKGETGTNRMLEVTGVGSLLMAEHYPVLSRHFEIGKEIETFKSFGELVEKVRFFRDNPKIRDEIALKGHQRCMRDHSMEVRVEELHSIIETCLGTTLYSTVIEGNSVNHAEKLKEVAYCFSSGEYTKIITLLSELIDSDHTVKNLHLLRGRALLLLGKREDAVKDFEQEAHLFPDNQKAQIGLRIAQEPHLNPFQCELLTAGEVTSTLI